MDFFEHQEAARRNTVRLLLLFLLAVGGIVGLVYLLVRSLLVFRFQGGAGGAWDARLFFQCASAVTALITAGSLWKIHQLGRGGAALAERVGGRRLDPASSDPMERRVLHVVEEMAIASGTPVPPVYLLDAERGINAFAAGHDASDAVIGVTRGALEVLERDELQGVIAHEFSHILNGDMGLNLQLIGLVHGIELIGSLGRALLRGGVGRGGRGRKAGGSVVVGGALVVIGGVGSLGGRLIRAAVSKQREYLADASAVQFTRNPEGVVGALRKIGGFGFGSHLAHPRRGEMSHMFFGSGLPGWDLSDLFGTHPPLEARIRRIDPRFDGAFPVVPLETISRWPGEAALPLRRGEEMASRVAHFAAAASVAGGVRGVRGGGTPRPSREAPRPPGASPLGARFRSPPPRPLLERLGAPGPEHLERARTLLEALPAGVLAAARELPGARYLFYATLLPPGEHATDAQTARILAHEGAGAVDEIRVRVGELAGAPADARLPLAEVLTGTLKGLSPDAYEGFRTLALALTQEGGVELSEWIRAGLVLRDLDRHFGKRRPPRAHYARFSGLEVETALVLSALAHAGGEGEAARTAFGRAAAELRLPSGLMTPAERCAPRALEGALERLAQLSPHPKKRLLAACAVAVAADGRVDVREAELFRVVADWLDCPAPPLLPGQSLA